MNKTIAIAGIITAFVVGALTTNPVVEAVGGWQSAFDGLDTRITALETSTTVELYTVSTTHIPPPQSVELNCNAGDTVISGHAIFPGGVSAHVNTVTINNGEGMLVGEEGATEISVVTFQIICAKGVI